MNKVSLRQAIKFALKYVGKRHPDGDLSAVLLRTFNPTTVAVVAANECSLIRVYAEAYSSGLDHTMSPISANFVAGNLQDHHTPTLSMSGEGYLSVAYGYVDIPLIQVRPSKEYPISQRLEDTLLSTEDTDDGVSTYSLRELGRLPRRGAGASVAIHQERLSTVFTDGGSDSAWAVAVAPDQILS